MEREGIILFKWGYDWIVTLHGRGSDGDGEVSATTCTQFLSKTSS